MKRVIDYTKADAERAGRAGGRNSSANRRADAKRPVRVNLYGSKLAAAAKRKG